MTLGSPKRKRETMQTAKMNSRVVAVVLTIVATLALVLTLPARAFADAPADVPRTLTGTCHIGKTWMVGDQSFFSVPSFSGGLKNAVPSTAFECIDHSAAPPENVDATYEATLCGYSEEECWVEYEVTITPPGVTDGKTRDEQNRLYGYQRVRGKVRLTWDFKGKLYLEKSSARTQITKGHPLYSLKGATYAVYSTKGSDGKLSDKVGTLTTDADGKTNTLELKKGTYYVKETKAPTGYLKDGKTHSIKVASGKTAKVEVEDKPANDPNGALVQKVDAVTGANVPVGDASLAGAEFTFRYYDGYYGADDLPKKAMRTWVMRTDENGFANIVYDGGYVVSGDSFYTKESGEHVLPLGTITAIETKAPKGYLIGTPQLFVTQIKYDASATNGVKRVNVNFTGVATTGNAVDAAQIKEQPQRGNVEVVKRDVETANGSAQGDATLAGAVFDVVNASEHAVVSPQTGKEVAKGGVVCQIVTDANGFASTMHW